MEPKTIPQRLSEEIYREISNGVLKPGQRLTERIISSKYNISHIPAREALKILEKDGIVTIYPYRGAIINKFDIAVFKQMVILHISLLHTITEGIVKNITAHDIEELEAIYKQVEKTESADTFFKETTNFITRFYSVSGYDYLVQLLSRQYRLMMMVGNFYFEISASRKAALDHYKELIAILKTENTESLYQTRKNYLDKSSDLFFKLLASGSN